MQSSRNYTKYSGAEEWLRTTYPHFYSIWQQSFNEFKEASMMNFELVCLVCRIKPSSGLHYGVKMCEADKQFLKRTFHYQIVYSPCPKEGMSVCDPRPRGWCQMCRLRRCLSTPVTISMIRVGNKSAKPSESRTSSASPPAFSLTVDLSNQAKLNPSPYFTPQTINDNKEQAMMYEMNYSVPQFSSRKNDSQTPLILTKLEPIVENICEPLDLSVKKPAERSEWFEAESGGDYKFLSGFSLLSACDEPLDLSPLSSHVDKEGAADYSRPSSRESTFRRTPSPIFDTTQAINKLSVNSTVLGDALSRIQGNISMSNSLINLSSISDILSVSQTDK